MLISLLRRDRHSGRGRGQFERCGFALVDRPRRKHAAPARRGGLVTIFRPAFRLATSPFRIRRYSVAVTRLPRFETRPFRMIVRGGRGGGEVKTNFFAPRKRFERGEGRGIIFNLFDREIRARRHANHRFLKTVNDRRLSTR